MPREPERLTLEHLEWSVQKPLVKEPSQHWLHGRVYEWSPVYEKWVDTNQTVSLRPFEPVPARGERLVAVIDR